jgi:serine phosphatase RsbU (regulator of sigma subunit)
MRFPFLRRGPAKEFRQPMRPAVPDLASMQVGALYRGARVGGDFYDFITAGPYRMLVLLLDIAGKRDEALHIAASVQEVFRGAADLFAAEYVNEPVAITGLLLEINRAIMTVANGVRCAPGFLGCYNETVGTMCYINAGHTPALLKDDGGVRVLEANGLPLGLFSHATHDAQLCAMPPGAMLLLVSRGLVETKGGHEEFGLDRVKQVLAESPTQDAQQLCASVLESVRMFLESQSRRRLMGNHHSISEEDPLGVNDVTALVLARAAAVAAVGTR